MELSFSAFAEQTPFSHLIVVRRPATVTKFQNATDSIYEYYNAPRLTNVNVNDYSITSLSDTVKQLPKHSVYDFIQTVMDIDPDYRYINVAPINDDQVMEPKVVPKLTAAKPKEFVLKPNSRAKKSMFSRENPITSQKRSNDVVTFSNDDGNESTDDELLTGDPPTRTKTSQTQVVVSDGLKIPFTLEDAFPNLISESLLIVEPEINSQDTVNLTLDGIVAKITSTAGVTIEPSDRYQLEVPFPSRGLLIEYISRLLITNMPVAQIAKLNDEKLVRLATLITNSVDARLANQVELNELVDTNDG